MVSWPPAAATTTFAVAVVFPVVLVAVNLYVVVADGLTDVDPLAKVEVNVPGVMAMPAAPEVDQVSVLLDRGLMLVGLAVNELITGSADAETTTCAEAVTEPAALVAVST